MLRNCKAWKIKGVNVSKSNRPLCQEQWNIALLGIGIVFVISVAGEVPKQGYNVLQIIELELVVLYKRLIANASIDIKC